MKCSWTRRSETIAMVVRRIGMLTLCLVCVSPALGQEVGESPPGRADELLELRRQRLAEAEPQRSSVIVKTLATIENRGFDRYVSFQRGDFRFGFGKISPVSSVAPAIQWAKPSLWGTRLKARAVASVSVLGYQAYRAQFGVFDLVEPPDYSGDGFLGAPFEFDSRSSAPLGRFLYANAGFRSFPQEEFYGLGPMSAAADRSGYEYREGVAELIAGFQPLRWLAMRGAAGWLEPDVNPGARSDFPSIEEEFPAAAVPGLAIQPTFLRLGAALFGSWEGDPHLPSAGLGVRYSHYDDREDGRFTFDRLAIDLRGEVPLGSRQRRWATRLYASSDSPANGAEVPFYLMQTLGGPDRLRGFRSFRFRDRQLLLISTEYRWEANPAVELAIFYDAGKVFADPKDRNFTDLERSWGVGIRFRNARRTSLRLEIGRSDEGTRFFFSFGPAF